MGCTDCGRKGGCDSRKHVMFAAVDEALGRLYPTRRWGERDEAAAIEGGVSREQGVELAAAIAKRLNTLALFRSGDADEWCDYIYVLCLGRTPSIVEVREGQATVDVHDELDEVDERYLRVALSGLACFAGVQEVAMTMRRQENDLLITESARSGVFDPVLLPRFQSLVAVLAEQEIRHLDFGEIVEPPPGFDPARYADRFGAEPVIANYLFFPQPPTTVSTVVLPAGVSSSA
jgi:hypothetical protein